MRRLLLHTCCGPCATYSVQRLRDDGFDLTAFWYNPNVHPFTEHQLRLDSMRRFAVGVDLPLVVAEGYDMPRYLREVVGDEADRCRHCYKMRLDAAAAQARQLGIDLVSTTLLISPYQNHELLRAVGDEVAAAHGVVFHYVDLRPGFRDSRRLARQLGLYRQRYCGCIYSEWERFGGVSVAAEVAKLEDRV